jgi:hypothetical protein
MASIEGCSLALPTQDEIEPFIELSLEGRKPHRVLNWKRLRDAVSLVLRTAE